LGRGWLRPLETAVGRRWGRWDCSVSLRPLVLEGSLGLEGALVLWGLAVSAGLEVRMGLPGHAPGLRRGPEGATCGFARSGRAAAERPRGLQCAGVLRRCAA
jgi:hypothetical protein